MPDRLCPVHKHVLKARHTTPSFSPPGVFHPTHSRTLGHAPHSRGDTGRLSWAPELGAAGGQPWDRPGCCPPSAAAVEVMGVTSRLLAVSTMSVNQGL